MMLLLLFAFFQVQPVASFVTRADSLIATNNVPQAIAICEEGLQSYPDSIVLKKLLGEVLFRQSPDSARAGLLLGEAAKASPRDPEAHHYYGQWLYLNHREQLSITEETKALGLSKGNAAAELQIYTVIALAQDALKQFNRADASFKKALSVNRKLPRPDPQATFEYAGFLKRNGHAEQARTVIDEILSFAPNFAPAHLELAKDLAREGESAKAVAEAELALSQQLRDPVQVRAAHALLARTYFKLGRGQQASIHQKLLEETSEQTSKHQPR